MIFDKRVILRRLRIFGVGFFLGCLMVYFTLIRGKDRSFTFWFPEDRVIEEVSTTPHTYRDLFLCQSKCIGFIPDSNSIAKFIKNANVNFSKSKPRAKPREYLIETNSGSINVAILDSMIVFKQFTLKNENCNCNF